MRGWRGGDRRRLLRRLVRRHRTVGSAPAALHRGARVVAGDRAVEPGSAGGLVELESALRLPAEGLLVDLACGRGGPGMWIARAAGARLVGVDFSGVAVSLACTRREVMGFGLH